MGKELIEEIPGDGRLIVVHLPGRFHYRPGAGVGDAPAG